MNNEQINQAFDLIVTGLEQDNVTAEKLQRLVKQEHNDLTTRFSTASNDFGNNPGNNYDKLAAQLAANANKKQTLLSYLDKNAKQRLQLIQQITTQAMLKLAISKFTIKEQLIKILNTIKPNCSMSITKLYSALENSLNQSKNLNQINSQIVTQLLTQIQQIVDILSGNVAHTYNKINENNKLYNNTKI